MKSKNIYILRHGQTDFNKKGVVQGSGIDAPLNETGRKQARAFYETYKDIRFDNIYASFLQRTHQTVQPFVEGGYSIKKVRGFNEINWGVHEGKSITPESHNYYANITKRWSEGEVHLPIEGGESPLEVQERVKDAADKVLSNGDINVLICMHGRAMRILLATLLGYPLSDMDIFPHHNTGLYQLEYDGKSFEVIKFNEHSHLNGFE